MKCKTWSVRMNSSGDDDRKFENWFRPQQRDKFSVNSNGRILKTSFSSNVAV